MKIEGKNRGGKGTTPVTTACPEAGKCKCEEKKKEKKKKILNEDTQPVIRAIGVSHTYMSFDTFFDLTAGVFLCL